MAASTLLSKLIRGAVGGIAGTVAMDLVQFQRYRRQGGEKSLPAWEFGGVDGWDDVSAPGQVAQMTLRRATGKTPPDAVAGPAQAIVHWGTGTTWGATLGLVGAVRSFPWYSGPLLGVKAWATSYVVLPLLGIYKPIWKYDAKTLATDLGDHLIFGTVAGLVYRILR